MFLEDQYDNQNTSSTWITVMDTINPEINDVTDMIYSEGNQSVFVEWVPVDENPFYYKIFLNNSLLQSGIWNTSYEVITQQLGGLSYGLYNTTIIVFDEVNNSNKDMLWIHVIDTISPQLDSPEDILYPEGDTGYSIHWTAQDTNPSEYYILCNDTVLQEGTWNETYEVISIIADGHPYGLYEYNLTVVDIDGNSFSDIVLVNVFDGNLPTILPVSDIYKGELDETTNLTWNPIDLHPKNYTIFLNDTIIRQGNWNETTEEIIVNLSNHELGCYNYTLRIFDIDDNSAVSDILVFVNDLTSPEINHLDSYHMVETTEGHYIEWQGSDLHPNKYTIFLNGSIVIDQAWNSSSELLRYSIDTLSRGTYNVTIILTDIGMNRVKDQLFIYVNDETAPMIEKSSNCQISEGTEGIVISWNVSDLHLYTYKLYRNTTVIAENFFNSTYETITVSLNGLQLGRWNFTLLSYDLDLNSKASNILVEVFDGTPPEILGPNNQKVAISSFPAILSWEPYDSHPTSYRITRNHTILTVGSWTSGTNISISLDNLEVGIYNLSIIIFDIGNNGAAHSVIITIYDDYIPILNSPDDQVFSEGEVPDIITWEISDNGLSHYQVLKNDSIIKSGVLGEFQDTVTIDPSTLESGTWNLTLVVHDRNGNVASDSVIVTITTSGAFTNNELVNLINTPIIGGSSIFIMLGIALLTLRKKKTKSQIHESSTSEYSPKKREIFVDIKRGGEFTGNRYKFKVKIENNSSNVITDVKVSLASYPKDALTAEGKMSREYAKIERGGFRTPTFEFLPKQDCVQGSIIANVTYIDSHGKPYSAVTEPLEIRAVCDLLRPESISPEDFMFKLAGLNHGEMMVRVEDWTPTEMLEKTGNILKDASFFQVSSEISNIGEYTEVRLQGWAKGIYTHKSLGVEVIITGKEGVKGATCVIKMIGEDDAMIMPAIDEIAKKIGAWLCPYCMGKLPSEMVNKLKEGISVGCPFCGVTIDY
ncbi:MAG: hypothetical protein BAJATHORv1_60001 [Candidatus Thorarchaeota archaeon]|nr:MAG: hypothetical protein BAJATHORv1_60001 [Candidatus Thorarchaeota archaeon]